MSGVRKTGRFAAAIHDLRNEGSGLKTLPGVAVVSEALKVAGVELEDALSEGGSVGGIGDFATGIGGVSEFRTNPFGGEASEGEGIDHPGNEVGFHLISVPVVDVVGM